MVEYEFDVDNILASLLPFIEPSPVMYYPPEKLPNELIEDIKELKSKVTLIAEYVELVKNDNIKSKAATTKKQFSKEEESILRRNRILQPKRKF